MKKIVTIVLFGAFCMVNAQAFKGKGDTKLNIGMTVQNGGTGILASTDFGLGENFSLGVQASYLLGGAQIDEVDAEYRFDAKARFNANLGSVLNISPKLDVYPGLNLGLKNFGGHLGVRYFFSDGFGIFTEFSAPFAKYDSDAASKYNNGTSFNFGASFNLD
jgi:outer membrane protein G